MGLSQSRVAALIRRRGSQIQWYHAIPTNEALTNPATLEPFIPLGSTRVPTGPMGENYLTPVTIYAYLSNKISQVYAGSMGVAEIGDYQLTLGLPFNAFLCAPVTQTPPNVVNDYNNGDFFVAERDKTPRTDRFFIEGARYTAKAKPVPILDHNQTIAWRLLIKRDEY